VKKSNVYTKTGDKGDTSLVGGTRKSKADKLIDLYGEVDELNSFLGVLRASIDSDKTYILFLQKLQHSLFNLGSLLACETEKRAQYNLPSIPKTLIDEIENQIDQLESELTPLKEFILPGGSISAANSHVCRVVTRRVERKLVSLNEVDRPDNALEFLNRLSDYFFVLARYLNKENQVSDITWTSKL